jgi:hypothetical protein
LALFEGIKPFFINRNILSRLWGICTH